MKNTKMIFFGTSEFAVPVLEALVKNGWPIVCVVTQLDKPANRGLKIEGSPVKIKALELGLKVFQPKTLKNEEAVKDLKSFGAEVAVLASYGKIIPKSVIDLFPHGILNIHPSLLPKYRGSSPIQTAILNGDRETGVTLMLLDEEMDHGDVVANSKFKIQNSKLWYRELEKELAVAGAKLLIEILPDWLNSKIKPREQDHRSATYTKLLTKDDGRLDWHKSAEEIERLVRAYDPWPGTWTTWQKKRLKILQVELSTQEVKFNNVSVGQVGQASSGELAVKCGQGFLIIKKMQLEGKSVVSGEEFLRGHQRIIDGILGA